MVKKRLKTMSVKTQDKKPAIVNKSAVETEETGSQQPTLLQNLVANFDAFICQRRGKTIRATAREAGFKFPVLDAWKKDTPNTKNVDKNSEQVQIK